MKIYIDFGFLQKIESQDMLTYLALLLAYLAYTWSVNRELDTWYSLFVSFKEELKLYESWLGGEGYKSSQEYRDKNSYSPYNNIFPLIFVALPEIIRRGTEELKWIPKEFSDFTKHLSLFNNRVVAFNTILDKIKLVCSADPVLSERLYSKLVKLGLRDSGDDVTFEVFKQRIKEMEEIKDEQEMVYLAKHIRRLNRLVHTGLISDKSRTDRLHSLLMVIQSETDLIVKKFNDHRPWFIRWQVPIFFYLFWNLPTY